MTHREEADFWRNEDVVSRQWEQEVMVGRFRESMPPLPAPDPENPLIAWMREEVLGMLDEITEWLETDPVGRDNHRRGF
jgi:hypothetical protein